MKKSYHSTVVPTTVAKTTRRRSVDDAMVPVGVSPPCGCSLMCLSFEGDVTVERQAVLAERHLMIYDFEYNAQRLSPDVRRTQGGAPHDGDHQTGQDHRDPRELRLPRRAARTPSRRP